MSSTSDLNRKAQVRSHRNPKAERSPWDYQGIVLEDEPFALGKRSTATVFLTGSECRFSCSMCDLWQYTVERDKTLAGAIPKQLSAAISEIEKAASKVDCIKLYNAANFFDEKNVPLEDLATIGKLCRGFSTVVVENHATLIGTNQFHRMLDHFRSEFSSKLEIAIGLESVDKGSMGLLNKQMLLEDYQRACEILKDEDIAIRTFVLLRPPSPHPLSSQVAIERALDAVAFGWQCGAENCSVIPTRKGSSGWLMHNASAIGWTPPTASELERTLELGLSRRCNREQVVTVDLWDWDQMQGHCSRCRDIRRKRLNEMQLDQVFLASYDCNDCR